MPLPHLGAAEDKASAIAGSFSLVDRWARLIDQAAQTSNRRPASAAASK
jgi:hypothetical protein